MKRQIFLNSTNPFVFNVQQLIKTIEINSITLLLKAPINDFIIEMSHKPNNKDFVAVDFYSKQHYNIIGYGMMNANRIVEITIFQKNIDLTPTNSFSIYFKDIETREAINFENINYIIDISYN